MAPSKQTPADTQRAIAKRAYERWQSRGCPPGDGREDWLRAEAELQAGGTSPVRKTRWLRLPKTLGRLGRARRAA